MTKFKILHFVIGVSIATASYGFFDKWMQMPGQMMQQVMPANPPNPPCNCTCDPASK
jgi:hypothetical protein